MSIFLQICKQAQTFCAFPPNCGSCVHAHLGNGQHDEDGLKPPDPVQQLSEPLDLRPHGVRHGAGAVVCPLLGALAKRDAHGHRRDLEAEELQQAQIVAVRVRSALHLVVDLDRAWGNKRWGESAMSNSAGMPLTSVQAVCCARRLM